MINWLGAVQSSRRPRSPSACVASLISGGVRRRTGRGIRWLTCWCTAATSEVPLGMPFEPDPELAAVALDFLTGPWPIGVVPMDRLHGVSLRDTATGRVSRKGAEIRGSVGADRTTCEMLLLRVSYPAIRHSKNERKGRTSMKHDWSTEELAAQWSLLPTEKGISLQRDWRHSAGFRRSAKTLSGGGTLSTACARGPRECRCVHEPSSRDRAYRMAPL